MHPQDTVISFTYDSAEGGSDTWVQCYEYYEAGCTEWCVYHCNQPKDNILNPGALWYCKGWLDMSTEGGSIRMAAPEGTAEGGARARG